MLLADAFIAMQLGDNLLLGKSRERLQPTSVPAPKELPDRRASLRARCRPPLPVAPSHGKDLLGSPWVQR